jgi:hypothetical protein
MHVKLPDRGCNVRMRAYADMYAYAYAYIHTYISTHYALSAKGRAVLLLHVVNAMPASAERQRGREAELPAA